MLLHKRWFVAAYWVVAVVLIGVGGALGAAWGDSQAPTFNNEDKGSVPANGVSHLLYQVFGGILLALVVAAVFAGLWLLLWARARRTEAEYDDPDVDDEDTMSVDDVEHMFDEDDEDPDEVEDAGPPKHRR
ncbi:hypothetical protein [Flexivirga oryzae]|uniref:Nitrogen fixation-related uncharacterized protein n=1 Tax=Flexivirga oryzae TaxID=1794944 RepID=A0A839N9V9_9MICO|nr:hypothetical protein [Flexivirga oryzae]MBB2894540.1 nitrogen fixation-related uncharacterized protein [Flexivirga oryzae]